MGSAHQTRSESTFTTELSYVERKALSHSECEPGSPRFLPLPFPLIAVDANVQPYALRRAVGEERSQVSATARRAASSTALQPLILFRLFLMPLSRRRSSRVEREATIAERLAVLPRVHATADFKATPTDCAVLKHGNLRSRERRVPRFMQLGQHPKCLRGGSRQCHVWCGDTLASSERISSLSDHDCIANGVVEFGRVCVDCRRLIR